MIDLGFFPEILSFSRSFSRLLWMWCGLTVGSFFQILLLPFLESLLQVTYWYWSFHCLLNVAECCKKQHRSFCPFFLCAAYIFSRCTCLCLAIDCRHHLTKGRQCPPKKKKVGVDKSSSSQLHGHHLANAGTAVTALKVSAPQTLIAICIHFLKNRLSLNIFYALCALKWSDIKYFLWLLCTYVKVNKLHPK